MNIQSFQAIEGVCAWPNLTLLPDGTIVASIFNQPCHGMWEGDLDCWASEDGGRAWKFRGRIAPHEPGTNRMNCAAGLANNGDLLALVAGWSHRRAPGEPQPHSEPASPLRAWVCRSKDGGANWQHVGELPASGSQFPFVPFGDVVEVGGVLFASAYVLNDARDGYSSYLLRSHDDGNMWGEPVCINPRGDETAILPLENGRWLAASRQSGITLFTSEDNGQSWREAMALTKPKQVTGHLLRLRDGRVLFSYGNRIEGEFGVEARFSEDGGRSWQPPFRLAAMPLSDGGYPSSVQREDGQIVTAYYAQKPGEYQYEMNALIWQP